MTERSSATALWLHSPGQPELRSEQLAPIKTGWVRVTTHFSGISRGTESLVFHGKVPAAEHQRMRCPFQQGEFPGPLKYGYSAVGVAENGALAGSLVFCLHPHQDRFQVPASAVFGLPANVPAQRAVLAANMETAINAIWDARLQIGDEVRVIGGGVIGALVAYLASRIQGARVQLIDVRPQRRLLAEALGVEFATPDSAEAEADVVFHASGKAAGLTRALELAGMEARVVDLSWYGDQMVTLPLGQAFHSRRLQLISSQVGVVATSQRARWDHRRRLALALRLLADPVLDALLCPTKPFADAPRVWAEVCSDNADVLCQILDYRSPPGPAH
jgi:threonine dehydrogenase-like Zn-dependent dehydrogenase